MRWKNEVLVAVARMDTDSKGIWVRTEKEPREGGFVGFVTSDSKVIPVTSGPPALPASACRHGCPFKTPTITELCQNGLSDIVFNAIAGHVSGEMLQRYSHIRLEAKRKALDGLEMQAHAIDTPAESQPVQRPN
jgi:hypothetical protein